MNNLKIEKKVDKKFILKLVFALVIVLSISIGMNIYSLTKINNVQNQIDSIQVEVSDSREANQQVLAMLQEVKRTQEKQNQALMIVFRERAEKKQQKQNVVFLKSAGLTSDTDLSFCSNISVEDMDRIINYYAKHVKGGTRFENKGRAFVTAAKETGLNPIYLFAHAAAESSYGNSYIAREKNNFFGINAVDSDPYGRSSYMGDTVDEGIINGAYWIKRNYYDNGYTTLNEMKDYYATDPNWANTIESIMRTSLTVI